MPLRLDQLRARYDWTQADLAEKLDRSDATITRCELGKQNWNVEFLLEAAQKLGVHWLDLLPTEDHPVLRHWSKMTESQKAQTLKFLKTMGLRKTA